MYSNQFCVVLCIQIIALLGMYVPNFFFFSVYINLLYFRLFEEKYIKTCTFNKKEIEVKAFFYSAYNLCCQWRWYLTVWTNFFLSINNKKSGQPLANIWPGIMVSPYSPSMSLHSVLLLMPVPHFLHSCILDKPFLILYKKNITS